MKLEHKFLSQSYFLSTFRLKKEKKKLTNDQELPPDFFYYAISCRSADFSNQIRQTRRLYYKGTIFFSSGDIYQIKKLFSLKIFVKWVNFDTVLRIFANSNCFPMTFSRKDITTRFSDLYIFFTSKYTIPFLAEIMICNTYIKQQIRYSPCNLWQMEQHTAKYPHSNVQVIKNISVSQWSKMKQVN